MSTPLMSYSYSLPPSAISQERSPSRLFEPGEWESLMGEFPLPPPPESHSLEQHPSPPRSSTSDGREAFIAEYDVPSSSPAHHFPPKFGGLSQQRFISPSSLRLGKRLVLPIMGFIYLAFCYTCHYRIVKIPGNMNPTQHLSIIKGGLTSISIIYVSITLLPIYPLVSDLKSEEFFRLLSAKHTGVPFKSVNSISIPSYGVRDGLTTVYRRNSSVYFIGAFIIGLVGIAVSTVSPAILSVGTVLFDGDLVALSVGAINRHNILETGNPDDEGPTEAASDRITKGGQVAWAETSLAVNYSFRSPTLGQATYIIPAPTNFSTNTKARWISDVVEINPACEWIAPDFLSSTAKLNFSEADDTVVSKLTSKNIQVNLRLHDIVFTDTSLRQLGSSWASQGLSERTGVGALVDLNTMNDITNGAIALLYSQCADGCSDPEIFNSSANDNEVHASRLRGSDGRSFDVSILYCDPKTDIQTRHVTNDGQGFLSVGEKAPTLQGNLHPIETSLLLSYALSSLDTSGPENETSYTSILQSAVKPFLDGSLASFYVPARMTQEIFVFSASPLHFISSTVLYAILSVFMLVCHFRRPAAQFTLFEVSSSLDGSNIPPMVAELKRSKKTRPGDEKEALASLADTRVVLDGEILRIRD